MLPTDRLFELLPAVIRVSDAKRENALRDLLRIIDEQADLYVDDLRQMYENFFIETCEPWTVPYIGDLVGYRPLFVPPSSGANAGARQAALVNPRQTVANRVGLARRKGTYSALDDLVSQTTGWHSRIAEDPGGPLTVRLRVWRLPSWPLTRTRPHYVPQGVNCFSLSVLGNDAPLFVRADALPDWDEDSDDERRSPPRELAEPLTIPMLTNDQNRYYGQGKSLCIYENGHPIDAARLVVRELRHWNAELVGDEVALDPVRGRVMFPERHRQTSVTVSSHHGFAGALGGGEYPRPLQGATAGMSLFREGHLVAQGVPFLRNLRDSVRPISAWLRTQLSAPVLTMPLDDPAEVGRRLSDELNRILQAGPFPPDLLPTDLELEEEAAALIALDPIAGRRIRLNRLLLEALYPDSVRRSFRKLSVSSRGGHSGITDAVRRLQDGDTSPMTAIVELTDSGLYVQPVTIEVRPFHTLIVRAAEGCRPTILLPERDDDIDDLLISCGDASSVVLDGLMVARRAVRITGNPRQITVRHCTLVPGWNIDPQCRPEWANEPSLVVSDIAFNQPWRDEGWPDCPPGLLARTRVCIDRSILGSIVVQRDEVDADPMQLEIRHSIVDATAKSRPALSAPGDRRAHAVVSVIDSTILGRTRAHAVILAENSIFTGVVDSGRRQIGCMRYCYVPQGSRTPRRYACQPDLVIQAALAAGADPAAAAARVMPRFMGRTVRYGRPDYCRLDDTTPVTSAVEILRGAEDQSEMGVFHDQYLPQRLENLEAAVADFLPLGWTHQVVLKS